MVPISFVEKRKRWQKGQEEHLAKILMSPPERITFRKAIPFPGVVVIMGAKGEGKSALAYEVMNQLHKTHGAKGCIFVPPHLAGIVKKLKGLVPAWVTIVTDLKSLPKGAVVLIDEASQSAHARRTQAKQSLDLDALVGISRQKGQLIIFISHHSRKLDPNLIHECDRILWKRPTYAHALFERSEISDFTFKALEFFNGIKGKLTIKKTVLMMDFHNLRFATFRNGIPPWWSEKISTIFEHV